MSDVAFGILIDSVKKYSPIELADELESASLGEKWSWVFWELNKAYFAIIKGSLRFKGSISQIENIEVISLGEAVEESEDSRCKWLYPAKASSGSVHELAQKKINNFVSAVYGGVSVADEEDLPKFQKIEERVLAPISTRRKFAGVIPGGGVVTRTTPQSKITISESEPLSADQNSKSAPIARKSRRGN